MISRVRSSASRREAMYTVDTGMPARSASTTLLRPDTISWVELLRPPLEPAALRDAPADCRPEVPRVPATARRSAATFALCAGWYSRSSALGVGPRPSRDRRFLPPVPALAVFLEAPLRTAPRRSEFPAMVSSPFDGGTDPALRARCARRSDPLC